VRPRRTRNTTEAAGQIPARAGWRELVPPVILLTALAFVALLYICTCARKSELDLQLRHVSRQIDQLGLENQALCTQINQARDPAFLRQIAVQAGMVFTPAGVDRIQLPRPLPPVQAALSPLAELPLSIPGPGAPLPAAALASRPPDLR
jgi:cell division protein FtsL